MNACLTHRVADGVLEVCLHREPANEIGLEMLIELERVAELLREGAGGAHAVIFTSSVPMGFSAGADLRELYAGLESVKKNGAWIDHAQRLFDSPSTAAIAGAAVLRGAIRDFSATGRRGDGEAGRENNQFFPPSRLPAFPLRSISERRLRKAATVWGVRAFLDRIHRVFDTFDAAPIPTIAAVHGVCFGGGFELALTCDMIVADKSARFAFPELRLGLIPGFGGIPRLERDLGNAVVRDLLLSGRSLGAKRAHEIGLAAQLVGEGQALNVARKLAAQMGRFDRSTVQAAKEFVKPLPRARLDREKEVFCHLLTSPAVEAALARFVSSTSAMPYLP